MKSRTGIKSSAPTVIVVFGITGDLAHRKLIPALYDLFAEDRLPENFSIVGVARRPISLKKLHEGFKRFVAGGKPNDRRWREFARRIHYYPADLTNTRSYQGLARHLGILHSAPHCLNVLFYLAVAPALYPVIAKHLHACGLSRGCARHDSFSRIIIEKPFGHDLASARELNRILCKCFSEEQIYRIDHYLGKETVQNILTFRFANDIFSPLWDRYGIDHVQITAAESIGIENRGAYYDRAGALRDMVQNHLLQLLAHVAMEEPREFSGRHVRRERRKVLSALRPLTQRDVQTLTARGQYRGGSVEGKRVSGYRQESSVPPRSGTETFVALKVYVDNDRWRGVPFYIRTGKRLTERYTEITVQFKERSKHLFRSILGDEPNMLYFRIQPDESITIRFTIKEPGLTQKVKTVETTLCYSHAFRGRQHEAYERLILDALCGDQTLFTHTDEVEAQWRFVSRILDAWEREKKPRLKTYRAGSWGPAEADRLIERDGRKWVSYTPRLCTPFQQN